MQFLLFKTIPLLRLQSKHPKLLRVGTVLHLLYFKLLDCFTDFCSVATVEYKHWFQSVDDTYVLELSRASSGALEMNLIVNKPE